MIKIVFFVPPSHVDVVKDALFAAGAGRIGLYDRCCWQVLGQGQFRALPGSRPFIGELDKVEVVEEYRVELVCEDHLLGAAIRALKTAHPYEEPAFEAYRLLDTDAAIAS